MTNNKPVFSKLGFVLAAAGSAIGLGNIWRLPAQVSEFGGGTYLVLYFLICITLGLAILLAEFAVGRYLGANYLQTNKTKLVENKKSANWGIVLWLAGIPSILILSFYFVVSGWVLFYFVQSILGGVSYNLATMPANYYSGVFSNLIINFNSVYAYTLIFIIATAAINYKGLIGGIEKVNFILLPLLFFILSLMIIRSLTLDGATAGLKYVFSFDYTKITKLAIIAALKQSFFSLSLGFSIMITFSASSNKLMNLKNTAFYTVALGSVVGLFTSVLIIPAIFSFGYSLNGGPALTFITLPNIFANLPFGVVFAVLFFMVMIMAAITSTISLYEVATNLIQNLLKISRNASILVLVLVFAILTFIQTGSFTFLSNVLIGKLGIFDFTANLSDILLVLFGLFSCIFAGYLLNSTDIKNEILSNGKYVFKAYNVWLSFIKYIAPVILIILLYLALESLF